MQISRELANTIVDPYAFAKWDPAHNAFSELRKNAPIAKAKPDDYDEFWIVSRYDDAQFVEKNLNKIFHCGDRGSTLLPLDTEKQIMEMTGGVPYLIRSLVQMDNPDHFKLRHLTQGFFMPQSLKKLEENIRAIARSFVKKMLAREGEIDFAKDIAFYYPLHVFMSVMGVPEADEPRMLTLTQELFGAQDPELNRAGSEVSPEEAAQALGAIVHDFHEYFSALSEDRKKSPRDDLATIIANAQIDGEPIKFLDAMGYYIISATAGHDTTSATTASGMIQLSNNPDMLADLKADPSGIAAFVEEATRWETPVKHFMRTAVEDTEIAGQKIRKDDYIYVSYASANRDDAVFDNPFTFDHKRTPNKQLAYGYGAHVCLGQHLARMEMRILWEELLPHIKSIEPTGEPKRMAANFVSGPKSVPIRFTAA